MRNRRNSNLELGVRHKLILDAANKALKPLVKAYSVMKSSAAKTKEAFPAFYKHFEELVKQHIITPSREMFKSSRIEDFGKFVSTSIVKRLPHISEFHIEAHKSPSSSFLEVLTKGLGIKNSENPATNVKFRRVLIANRGEIALRIIRACRELGIESVAIYSEQDKGSLAAKFADKSYNIGNHKNYLSIKKIVRIAEKGSCDAIHPGYGFLAENPRFARLCERKGIKFIGPPSKMMKRLSDKVEAKNVMLKANIPVIEGVKESLRSKRHALRAARRIGFPVILKASAGGGGRGMRIVEKEEDIPSEYESAKQEALNAFGDDSLYIERYLEEPRHIEFQLLADRYGNVVHLGERDCSIQRRHQKLLEEAPSPALDSETREAIGNAAVNALKSIGYEGAGTIEFLLDKNKNFYFIEMNTRIQVEHGVTEMVANIDLVKEQIRIAEGARLAYTQEEVKIEGHAIECRINAEDSLNNFVPSSGAVVNYIAPGGTGIRISSACHNGCHISPEFDSLIALLICHGRTRHEAIQRMKMALGEFVIEGVKTTIPFHQAVLGKRQFLRGNATTSFIENNNVIEELKALKPKKERLTKEKKVLVVTTAVAQYLAKKQNTTSQNPWIAAARQEALNEGSLEE